MTIILYMVCIIVKVVSVLPITNNLETIYLRVLNIVIMLSSWWLRLVIQIGFLVAKIIIVGYFIAERNTLFCHFQLLLIFCYRVNLFYWMMNVTGIIIVQIFRYNFSSYIFYAFILDQYELNYSYIVIRLSYIHMLYLWISLDFLYTNLV